VADEFAVAEGRIGDRWREFGAAEGPFGRALGPEEDVPGTTGRRQRFERGEIAWSPDQDMVVSVYRLRNEAAFLWSVPRFDHDYARYDIRHDGVGQGQALMKVTAGTRVDVRLQGFGEYEFVAKSCESPTIGSDHCRGWTVPVRVRLGVSAETPEPPGLPPVAGPIAERWHELGAWSGPLGVPSGPETVDAAGVRRQAFAHGGVATSTVPGPGMVVAAYQRGRLIEVTWGGTRSGFNAYRVDVTFDGKLIMQRLVHEILPTGWARPLSSGVFRFHPSRGNGVYGVTVLPASTLSIQPVLAASSDPDVDVVPASTLGIASELDPNLVRFLSGATPRVDVTYDFGPLDARMDLPALEGGPAHAFAGHRLRAASIARHYLHTTRQTSWPAGQASENNTILLVAYLQVVSEDPASRVDGELPNHVVAHALLRAMDRGHGQVGTSYDEFFGSRKGDYDMALKGLMVVLHRYRRLLTRQQVDFVLRDLVPGHLNGPHDQDIMSYGLLTEVAPETENHMLMINSTRYLVNQILFEHTGDTRFDNAGNGLTNWLLAYLQVLVKHDFLEFNSRPYGRLSLHVMINLHEFAKDTPLRTAAQIVLDYVMTKFAVSSNRMRRVGPFRRLHERTNRADNANNDLLHDSGDPVTGFFLAYAGPRALDGAPTEWFPDRWTFNALIVGLAAYRPPPAAYTLALTPHPPVQHRFYHGARPEVFEADERASGGLEIYYSSPAFLMSAGGMYLNSGYGGDEFTKYKQVSIAQSTTLVPTRTEATFAELIRFDPYPGDRDEDGEPRLQRDAVNTGVHLGFACGANLVVPDRWLRMVGAVWEGPWLLLDLDDANHLGPTHHQPDRRLGMYVAVYRTEVTALDRERLTVNYGTAPDSFGLVYAVEATEMPFATFAERVRVRNTTLPAAFEWGGLCTFHTVDEPGHVYDFWMRPDQHGHTPRVFAVDGAPLLPGGFTSLPLVEGPYMFSAGHDGLIEIRGTRERDGSECATPLILDFRDPHNPVRVDTMDSCPTPWEDRTAALIEVADRLVSGQFPEGSRFTDPVVAAQAAVDVLRDHDAPTELLAAFRQRFAEALHNLAVRRLAQGRAEVAAQAGTEAITEYRGAVAAGADPVRASSNLQTLSAQLAAAAPDVAAEAQQAAVDILRAMEPPPG
jgi:hypothetical protein